MGNEDILSAQMNEEAKTEPARLAREAEVQQRKEETEKARRAVEETQRAEEARKRAEVEDARQKVIAEEARLKAEALEAARPKELSAEEKARIQQLESEGKSALELALKEAKGIPIEEIASKTIMTNATTFPRDLLEGLPKLIEYARKYRAIVDTEPGWIAKKAEAAKIEAKLKALPTDAQIKQLPKAKKDKVLKEKAELEGDYDLLGVPFIEESLKEIERNRKNLKKAREEINVKVDRVKEHIAKKTSFGVGETVREDGTTAYQLNLTDSLETSLTRNPGLNTDTLLETILPQLGVSEPYVLARDVYIEQNDINDRFGQTPRTLKVMTILGDLAKNLNENFQTVTEQLAPLNKAYEEGTLPQDVYEREYKDGLGTMLRTVAMKELWLFYSNPYNIMAYRNAVDEEMPEGQQMMIKTNLDKILSGDMISDADRKKMTGVERKTNSEIRANTIEILDGYKTLGRFIQYADDIEDAQLMEISNIIQGVDKLLKNGIRQSIKANRSLKGEMDYFRVMLANEADNDEHMFAASDKKPVKDWLKSARKILSNLSQKGKNMVYLGCALKLNPKPSEITSLQVPPAAWKGHLEYLFNSSLPAEELDEAPKPAGSGRVRRHSPIASSPIDAHRGRGRPKSFARQMAELMGKK